MLPNAVLSSVPLPAAFLAPRELMREAPATGLRDFHYGGVAVGDPSLGISYQLWTAIALNGTIYLEAPNTPRFALLPGVGAVWVALAFDQNARVFVAYADVNGNASYYWFDTLLPGYRTSTLSGVVPRVFAALDDKRPVEIATSDVILAYRRNDNFYFRAQRDRFGVEYDLGAAPGLMTQIGMNRVNRFQFGFQNIQGANTVPPAEFNARPPL
jgi:hypothetical protein